MRAARTKRASTRHYRINVQRAEYLSTRYPLSVVDIREVFEDVPVKKAISLIEWAIAKNPERPYRTLLAWARKNEQGFYSREVRRRSALREAELYNEHLGRKLDHSLKTLGRPLLASEIDRIVRDFNAPAHRASLRLAEDAHDQPEAA